jgi:hypothetical protein
VNAQTVSAIISGASVVILTAIGRMLLGMRKDFRRFMAEHAWLIATTLWTRDKVVRIMDQMNMPMDTPPPNDLPHDRR